MKSASDAALWSAAVEGLPAIANALTVDVGGSSGDGCAFLFVVLQPGETFDASLRDAIHRRCVETADGGVPDAIYAAPDLPRGEHGRVLGAAVRRTMTGEPAARVAAEEGVENPAALDYFGWLFSNL